MNEPSALTWALNLLILQGLLGAFDTIYHHELTVGLPRRRGAQLELSIHAVRAVLYGLVFAGIANLQFHGLWAVALAVLVLVEVVLTLWDFVVEDRTRKLPSTERIVHTILAINGGALFALYGWHLTQRAALPTALVAAEHGWRGWLLTLFAVGVAFSGVRDGLAALRWKAQPADPNPFEDQPHRRLLVTGGTGFIGEALVTRLLAAGHSVTVLTRDPLRAAYQFDGRANCVLSLRQLSVAERFDAVINLAGAPIVGPRWSRHRMDWLIASRVDITRELADWVARADTKPGVWVQGSGVGFYGVRAPDEQLTERSPAGNGFMAELCQQWEQSASCVSRHSVRLVTLRLGLVFGPGGPLPPLLAPHYFGLGARIGDGHQVMSWIHRDDLLAFIATALNDSGIEGVYNLVSPEATSQANFCRTASDVLRRPQWVSVPATPLRWMAGEMAQLFADGQHVIPRRLSQMGFGFRFPTLRSALEDLA